MQWKFPRWREILILMGLAAGVAAPVIISGMVELARAQAAQAANEHAAAMEHFQYAARRLPWRRDLWEPAGREALAADAPQEAIRFLKRVPALSSAGWLALAEARRRTGDLGGAEAAYRAALQQSASAEAYAGLAYVARLNKDPEAERAALQNGLLLAPGDAAAEYRLGLLLLLTDAGAALPHLQTAVRLDQEYEPVFQTLSAAVDQAEMQATGAGALLYRGRGLALVGEWELARRAFEQAVQQDESSGEAWAWLAEAKQHLGQEVGADMDRAVALNGGSAVVRGLRGLFFKRQGREREALAEYQAAAAAEPENPAWAASLGESYARLGDLVSALGSFKRATGLAPNDPAYWRLLATFCMEYNVQISEAGLPAAQKAVELAPEDPLALDTLGWTQLGAGQLDAAKQTLLSARERDPSLALVHLHLALVYLQTGERQEAYQQLRLALELDPEGTAGQQAAGLLKQYFP